MNDKRQGDDPAFFYEFSRALPVRSLLMQCNPGNQSPTGGAVLPEGFAASDAQIPAMRSRRT